MNNRMQANQSGAFFGRFVLAASILAVASCGKPATKDEAKAAGPGKAAEALVIPARIARFAGTWERVDNNNANPTGGNGAARRQLTPMPLTPEYAKRYAILSKAIADGGPLYDVHANCLPYGMPRIMGMPLPFETLVTPSKLVIIPEDQSPPRTIWLDGRSHPTDVDPSYNGHSIGRWEGEALVVDTVGLRDDIPIEGAGLTPTKNLRVVERFSFEPDGVLRDEITSHDPAVFSTPWTVVRRYMRADYELQEMVCEENNRNPLAADGSTQLKLKTAKP